MVINVGKVICCSFIPAVLTAFYVGLEKGAKAQVKREKKWETANNSKLWEDDINE